MSLPRPYILPLALGLVFFAASLTPTLIPRGWAVQGALGGLVMAFGYLIGRAAVALWRMLDLPEPTGRIAGLLRLAVLLPALALLGLGLVQAREWQNGIRLRMDMPPLQDIHATRMLLLALLVFALLFGLGLALQWLFDRVRFRLYRYMPARAANVAGLVLTGLMLLIVTRDGVLDRVIAGLDASYTTAQALFDTAPPIPAGVETGSPASLVDWEALGQPGRNYVTSGPGAAEIATVTGQEAMQPVRVYVGLAQADDPEARARIALAELERQGGFDRAVLIVALPTGTGWLDPGAVDTVEYMHGGDIATVAVQYSYLQSPLALILEMRSGLDQADALIGAIHRHWRDLPADSRPRLYIHGLSLGAWASMHGTDLFALLDDPINGALWAGPPFPSVKWQGIVGSRNPGSPYVAPDLGDGRLVRFASRTKAAGGAEGWGNMRLVYLQYASDPIVFYEPASLFRPPAWMREPPAQDVSPAMRFMPVVTQFQLAVDMALANTAPEGHGHVYAPADYAGAWIAVTDPAGWTEEMTARLMAHVSGARKAGVTSGSTRSGSASLPATPGAPD